MSHPLDGARLKIIRANEHLESLNVAIGEYEKRNPYSITIGNDPATTITPNVVSHPDPILSGIIGDCIHNLSCALDYVMWEIAWTYAGRILRPPPLGDDRPYFPLWGNPGSFRNYATRLNDPKRWNYKIPDRVITAFESVQPYQTGYDCLRIFKILTNADKHRLPLVAQGEIKTFNATIARVKISDTFPPHLADTDHYAPQVKTQATVHVTWHDPFMPRVPVIQTMREFVECIANIIPTFDNFVV